MSSTPHSLANTSLGWFHSLLLLAAAATSPPPPLAHNHKLGVVSVFHDDALPPRHRQHPPDCHHSTIVTAATSIAPCECSILALRMPPSSLPRARLQVHPHGRIAHVEVASPPPSPPHSASITHHHNPQPQVDNTISTPRSPASPSTQAHRACQGGITTTITTPFHQCHPPSQSTTAGRQHHLRPALACKSIRTGASVTHHHNPQPQVDNAVSTAPQSPASPSAWAQHACRGPHHHHHHHPVLPLSPTVTAAGSRHLHHPALANASTGIDKMCGGLKSLVDKVAQGEAEHDEVEHWLQEKQMTLTWFNVDATIPIAPQSPARPHARAQRACQGTWHHHHHHPIWPAMCMGTACMPRCASPPPSPRLACNMRSAHAEACITTTVTPSGLRHAHRHSAHAEVCITTTVTLSGL
ncbi:hypothetical protein BJV78DRAFT_1289440 [Lactifluus subvellereus]|nr:hypothetical protein BJV78DRAFT_1289440 [Lactifluus subvellereus]